MEYNIENEEGILTQGKGNYCPKLKKGKLKTKKLLQITRYIRWIRVLGTISSASLKLRKYESWKYEYEVHEKNTIQNIESSRHSIYIWK